MERCMERELHQIHYSWKFWTYRLGAKINPGSVDEMDNLPVSVKVEEDLASLLDLHGESELDNLIHIVECLRKQPSIVVLKYEIHIKVGQGDTQAFSDQDNLYIIRQGDFEGDASVQGQKPRDELPQAQNDTSVTSVGFPGAPDFHGSFLDVRNRSHEEFRTERLMDNFYATVNNCPEELDTGNELNVTGTLSNLNKYPFESHSQQKEKAILVHAEMPDDSPAQKIPHKESDDKEEMNAEDDLNLDDKDLGQEDDSVPVKTENLGKYDDSLSVSGISSTTSNRDSDLPSQQSVSKGMQKAFKCLYCSQSFDRSLSLRIHELCHPEAAPKPKSPLKFLRYAKRPYRCPSCDFKHLAKRHMETHLTETHNYARFFICSTCKFVCIKSMEFEFHMSSQEHHDVQAVLKNQERNYLCPTCAFRAKSKTILNAHMLVHLEDKPYSCKQCGFRCKTQARLKNHEEIHRTEKKFQCHLCTFSSHIKHHLKRHIESHSRSSLKYKCRQCSAVFKNMHKLKDHALYEHHCPDFYFCAECPYSCQDRKLYMEHMQIHRGRNPFACDKCEYTTNVKHQLEAHKLTHSDVKPFSCSVCGNEYASKTFLKKHEQIHEPKKLQYFPCHLCSFTAKCKRLLNNHMRSHVGFKSHKCPQCDYSTKYRGNLHKHQLKHLDVKSYACDYCEFACKLPESLRRHKLRIHKNEILQISVKSDN